MKKTTFKLPSVTKFPTAEDLEFYKLPCIKSDYKKVYGSLSMAEYYRVPSKQIDLLAFEDEKLKEIIVGVVNKKVAILIVKHGSIVSYFLKV